MMTVLALLLIFASFALPTYQNIVLRTREAALRDDLYTLRSLIDRFTLDNQRTPASLEELVEAGYLADPANQGSAPALRAPRLRM